MVQTQRQELVPEGAKKAADQLGQLQEKLSQDPLKQFAQFSPDNQRNALAYLNLNNEWQAERAADRRVRYAQEKKLAVEIDPENPDNPYRTA